MKELNETSQNLTPSPAASKYDYDPIQQLELKVDKKNKQDYNQVMMILTQILSYPSNQLAQLHMDSDRLGTKDLREEINQRISSDKQGEEQRKNLEFCPCCGFAKQRQTLKICTHLGDINNIGISTYLYFQTIKNLVFLLLVMVLGYSIYALITNLKASGVYQQLINSGSISNVVAVSVSYVALSLGSKQVNPADENKIYYLIQCWIGVGLVTVWLFMFFILKYFEKEKEEKVQVETISASDFTVMLEHAPSDMTKQELQAQLDKYYTTIRNVPAHLMKPLKVSKINKGKPFYLNEQDFKDDKLTQLRQRHEQLIKTFIEWIEHRQDSTSFNTTKQERDKKYAEYKDVLTKQAEIYKQIGSKIEQKIKQETEEETTTFFITFQTGHAMKLFARLNDPTLPARIRYYLTCCQGHNKFHFVRGERRYHVRIQRAPEPQDIIWTNLGVPFGQAVKRKIITFTVTFILLGASFGIVYGLSKAQKQSNGNSILSLAISVSISVINIILSIVINKLSLFEKDFTITKYQTSLAMKSILASLINSIVIPVIVNYYIKEDIYSDRGLASDVFMLGLTNSLVTPILKIFNISYLVNRIMKYFASRPGSRLSSNQRALNDKFEYLHFQVGLEYVYLVSTYLFTCFFVSMQPIIALFAIVGFGMMYWAQKHTLFNRMSRPVPGTDLVNVTMFQVILLGGLIYSLGSLTWSNFMPAGIPKEALLPNLIAVGISVVTFLLPYRAIIAVCSDQNDALNDVFDEKRILLSTQYDRLNPVTSAQALEQYRKYYENYIKKFEKASEADKNKLLQMFAKQNARGHQRPQPQMAQNNPFGSMFQGPAFLPPPPQMMFMAPPPPVFQPQGYGYRPPAGPGFQQTIQASTFVPQQQLNFQQVRPQNNVFSPVVPMPGPTFVPANQPPMNSGFQQPGFQQPGFQQPGFQQPNYRPPGFQQPGFQPPGFQQPSGFSAPQNFGFQAPSFQPFGNIRFG